MKNNIKVKDIINTLEKQGSWVDWSYTRDRLLIGDHEQNVHKVGVCWTLTNSAIEEAISKKIDLIITHENPFYLSSTQLPTCLFMAQKEKEQKIKSASIAVYRCHDMWDCCPNHGIADTWAHNLHEIILNKKREKFITFATIKEKTVKEIAVLLSQKMLDDGENGVYMIGKTNQIVHSIAMGTGAATNVFEMSKYDPDLYIVSEDGINCWSSAQYIVDKNKSMIVVSHCCCEKGGLKQLPDYLKQYLDIDVEYIDDHMHATFVAIDG